MRIPSLLLITLTCAPAHAQGHTFTIAEGASASSLTVRTNVESWPLGQGSIVLTAAEFLPVEITNRTLQQELRSDRARRLDRDGLARIELPGNARVLAYRLRGGERYGFLHVSNGGARVLLELPGIGASGKDGPFADRCAVAPDGRHAAFTTLSGTVHVARLDGLAYASTGTPSRKIAIQGAVDPFSVCVGATQLFCQDESSRVWRCALGDGGLPLDLTPQPAPALTKELMAQSGDGTAVAFLAGSGKTSLSIWLLRETGAAVPLAPIPSKYEEPTYLPEAAGGPRLALNEDASRLLYIDASSRDELHLLDTTSATSPVWITSDANFQPYIGIGILPIFMANQLVVGVGDPGKFDVYTAQTGQPLVANLTQTGGNTVRPYGVGTLVPTAAFASPAGKALLVDVDAQAVTRLRAIDPATTQATLLHGSLSALPQLGSSWAGMAEVLVPSAMGDQLWSIASLVATLAVPAGVTLSPPARAPGDAFTLVRASAAGLHAFAFLLPGNVVVTLPVETTPLAGSITASGNLLLQNAGGIHYVTPAGLAGVPAPGPVRRILSGAGV